MGPPAELTSPDGSRPGDEHSRVVRSAGVVGAAVFLSRITGLVREVVFANFFAAAKPMPEFEPVIKTVLLSLIMSGMILIFCSRSSVRVFIGVRSSSSSTSAWTSRALKNNDDEINPPIEDFNKISRFDIITEPSSSSSIVLFASFLLLFMATDDVE